MIDIEDEHHHFDEPVIVARKNGALRPKPVLPAIKPVTPATPASSTARAPNVKASGPACSFHDFIPKSRKGGYASFT